MFKGHLVAHFNQGIAGTEGQAFADPEPDMPFSLFHLRTNTIPFFSLQVADLFPDERAELLECLLAYYKMQVSGFNELRSISVLKELFAV